jgi:hypothetical protein
MRIVSFRNSDLERLWPGYEAAERRKREKQIKVKRYVAKAAA